MKLKICLLFFIIKKIKSDLAEDEIDTGINYERNKKYEPLIHELLDILKIDKVACQKVEESARRKTEELKNGVDYTQSIFHKTVAKEWLIN